MPPPHREIIPPPPPTETVFWNRLSNNSADISIVQGVGRISTLFANANAEIFNIQSLDGISRQKKVIA